MKFKTGVLGISEYLARCNKATLKIFFLAFPDINQFQKTTLLPLVSLRKQNNFPNATLENLSRFGHAGIPNKG